MAAASPSAPSTAPDHASAIERVLARFIDAPGSDAATLAALHRLAPLDPDDRPPERAPVAAAGHHFPGTPQFACLETALHHDLPRVALTIAITERRAASAVAIKAQQRFARL